jgi:hypothetical protein
MISPNRKLKLESVWRRPDGTLWRVDSLDSFSGYVRLERLQPARQARAARPTLVCMDLPMVTVVEGWEPVRPDGQGRGRA